LIINPQQFQLFFTKICGLPVPGEYLFSRR
jgi:hypothetical protein